MEETLIVVMLREKNSGFYFKEIGAYSIHEHEELLVNINADEIDDEIIVNMRVTIDREVEDWEFNAIYDYYDTETVKSVGSVISVDEIEDSFDPTWEIKLHFDDNDEVVEKTINDILDKHHTELLSVYEEIKDKENEYK